MAASARRKIWRVKLSAGATGLISDLIVEEVVDKPSSVAGGGESEALPPAPSAGSPPTLLASGTTGEETNHTRVLDLESSQKKKRKKKKARAHLRGRRKKSMPDDSAEEEHLENGELNNSAPDMQPASTDIPASAVPPLPSPEPVEKEIPTEPQIPVSQQLEPETSFMEEGEILDSDPQNSAFKKDQFQSQESLINELTTKRHRSHSASSRHKKRRSGRTEPHLFSDRKKHRIKNKHVIKLKIDSEDLEAASQREAVQSRAEMQKLLDSLSMSDSLEEGEIHPLTSRKPRSEPQKKRQRIVYDLEPSNRHSLHHSSLMNGVRIENREREREQKFTFFEKRERDREEKFTFFFTKKYPFSNHYPCRSLRIDGRDFTCTEQYYMYMKAVTFQDKEAAEDIIRMTDPKQMKGRSRSIRNFNQDHWDNISHSIMRLANLRKYEQNPELRKAIFETAGTTLVETNPTDQRWGIGLSMDDPRAQNRSFWRGQNLLGETLTEIRETLWHTKNYKDEVKEVKKILHQRNRRRTL